MEWIERLYIFAFFLSDSNSGYAAFAPNFLFQSKKKMLPCQRYYAKFNLDNSNEGNQTEKAGDCIPSDNGITGVD